MDCAVSKAALYIRVSTEEQALEGQSVDAQIETLTQYCRLYSIDIFNIYRDLGVSGKSARNRPGLQEMLKDASKGKFHMVLVWKISRLSRSLKDLLLILDELDKHNVVFTSYSEKFDTSNAVGRMTLQLLGSIAEFERNTIVDNVKLGLREYARKGGKTGTILGYDSVNKKLIVNDKEAEIVKLIFRHYVVDKMSMDSIADTLNSQGYLTKRGKNFRKDGIAVILANPAYIGINRHNIGTGQAYETAGAHLPIIDNETWASAQSLRQSNKHIRPAKDASTGFLLSGKLFCKDCASSMTGFSTKAGSKTYRYYKCKSCGRLISSSRFECKVRETLYSWLQDHQDIVESHLAIKNSPRIVDRPDALRNIQKQISSLSQQLDKYVALLSVDDLSGSQVIIEKIKCIEEKLDQLQIKKNSLEQSLEKTQGCIHACLEDQSLEGLKSILDLTVKNIEINNNSGRIILATSIGDRNFIDFEF